MLENILYIVLIVFLIVMIIIGLKVINLLTEINKDLEDINKKLHSLDGVFDIIEKTTDTIGDVKYKIALKIGKLIRKIKRKEDD